MNSVVFMQSSNIFLNGGIKVFSGRGVSKDGMGPDEDFDSLD